MATSLRGRLRRPDSARGGGPACAKWSDSSATMPLVEAPQASCTPVIPAARAASAVVGPMHTTWAGTRTGAPSGVRSARNACTDEVAVSTSASAWATRARSAGSGAASGTVRYASTRRTSQPLCARPRSMVSGAMSAHGNSTPRAPSAPACGNSSTKPRALCSAGTRSGSTPSIRSASDVAGPTAATDVDPSARASRSSAMKRSTALTEVNTIHRHAATDAAADRSATPPSDGATWRVSGSSTVDAPVRSSASTRPTARVPARVTTMVRPVSARPPTAAGDSCANPATGPTTMTAGDSRSTAARPLSVVCTTCWAAVVARATTAAGVSGARPPAISASAMAARVDMPMRITRVPPARASASQSGAPASAPGAPPTRPVTTVTDEATPRWVTGMPATAGAANAEVTPGTTSNGMPACTSASTSSPPRPKTKGSPPLRRTTTSARRPCSTSSRAISSCRSSWLAGRSSAPASGRLPTSINSAESAAKSSTAGLTRRSWSTTSARARSIAPRRVSRPGSPGPAPTRYTVTRRPPQGRPDRSPRSPRPRHRAAPRPPPRREPRGRRPVG